MKRGSPMMFDTTVYITAVRQGPQSPSAQLLRANIPRTHFAAVVAAELRAGARSLEARRAVTSIIDAARGVGRLVTPSLASWLKAGEIMARIRSRNPAVASKLPRLWNDLLIALSAAQVGAIVVTHNRDDFVLLRRHVPFTLTTLRAADGPS